MEITTRIIKGGALLEDSRRFVDEWDPHRGPKENLELFRSRNMLGKRSRSRAEDTLAILRQRFIQPGPEVVLALKVLTVSPDAFRAACYYEAARNDDLLAYTASEVLYASRQRGWIKVTVEDVERALLEAPLGPAVKEWGESTRRRVIHGLLSALRDFEVLEGLATKHLARPHMPFAGFAYVLGRLRARLSSSHEIVTSSAWRWWLLDDHQVRSLFLDADREGLLRFSEAGTTVRIDWRTGGLEEMVRAVA
jgi:BrxA